VLAVAWQFRIAFIYIALSLMLAAAVRPMVDDWKKHRLAMRIVLIFLYLIWVGSFVYLIIFSGKFALDDLQELTQTLSAQGHWNLPFWLADGVLQDLLLSWLPAPDKLFEAMTGEQGQFILPAMLNFTENIGSTISGILLILLLSTYWIISQVHFERLWLSLLPSEQRKHARRIWRTIEPDLGAYIRSEVIQSVLAALLLGCGYWLLGSPYPALLALTGALAWLIPVVGVALAIIPPLLVGILTSADMGLITVIFTVVILIILQVALEPRLFKRDWDNPILTLIILLAMADVFGLLGILIAPPLSAVFKIVWNLLISNPLKSGAAVQIRDLMDRQERIRESILKMGELPPPLVVSIMDRLSQLLEKAEPILLPAASDKTARTPETPLP
jgi:predicted PurR-regulated permease PerM